MFNRNIFEIYTTDRKLCDDNLKIAYIFNKKTNSSSKISVVSDVLEKKFFLLLFL